MMMNTDDAKRFADEWIEAWNTRDLERVLGHYAAEIVFLSPVAERRLGNGRVQGIAALRAYWEGALAAITDLRFELESVLVGYECLTILYHNQRGQQVAETVEFDAVGKVVRSFACYC
jgi:ketosteroid isomerase-like protein